jgi:hypothetical protein
MSGVHYGKHDICDQIYRSDYGAAGGSTKHGGVTFAEGAAYLRIVTYVCRSRQAKSVRSLTTANQLVAA